LSAVSALAVLAAGTAGVVSLSSGAAQATEPGADGVIATESGTNLVEQNADGTGLKTLAPPPGSPALSASQPAWSSDGSMLAWKNTEGACGIYLSPADLSSVTGLSGANYTACYGESPTWADSNKEIVYSLFEVPGTTVWYQLYQAPVSADSGPAGPLFSTDTGFNDTYPRAVGNLIAFTRTPRSGTSLTPQVWIYDTTTSSAHLVVDNAQDADISPDGKSLVFTRPGSQDLFTSAVDGTDVKQLTTNGATVQHQFPVWSPSGTKIAFDNGTNSSVLDVAGGTETVLTGSGRNPQWQPINASAPTPPTGSPSTTPPTTPPPTTPPSTTPPTTPPSTPPSSPPSSPPPTNPGPPQVPLVQRIAGTDRFDTGVKTSRLLWPDFARPSPIHAKAVVLATGASFPDALAGGPLAHAAQGPLLLTDPHTLTSETFGEIMRVLQPGGTVYVLGGTSAVSPTVAAELSGAGYHVQRLGGTDRYATARVIADEIERLTPTPAGQSQAFVLATGTTFADALSAGPLASLGGLPILLSDGPALDPATRAYLSGKEVLPVGGPAYQAAGFAPDPGQECGDLAGPDRYATSAAVAHCIAAVRADAGVPASIFTGVATGTNYADALTGGAFLGMFGDPLLLTTPQSLSAPSAAFLASEKQTVGLVEIFGGPNAVSAGVESSIVNLLGGRELAPLTAPAGQPAPAAGLGSVLGLATRPTQLRGLHTEAAPLP
jgi:putative cell wall-binding protein